MVGNQLPTSIDIYFTYISLFKESSSIALPLTVSTSPFLTFWKWGRFEHLLPDPNSNQPKSFNPRLDYANKSIFHYCEIVVLLQIISRYWITPPWLVSWAAQAAGREIAVRSSCIPGHINKRAIVQHCGHCARCRHRAALTCRATSLDLDAKTSRNYYHVILLLMSPLIQILLLNCNYKFEWHGSSDVCWL